MVRTLLVEKEFLALFDLAQDGNPVANKDIAHGARSSSIGIWEQCTQKDRRRKHLPVGELLAVGSMD